MKPAFLTLAVLLSLIVPPWAIAAQGTVEKGTAAVQPSLMPAERAKAMFEDERVHTFIAVAAKDFEAKCDIPDHTTMAAKLLQKGSGDFSSSFYEVSIPCTGKNGLVELQITAEFSQHFPFCPLGHQCKSR